MKTFLQLLMVQALSICAFAGVRLPKIFGDNMVLQRNKPIPVWGWADAGENITIQFDKQIKKTKAGKDSKWSVSLSPQPAGGPFQLIASGKNKVVIDNVLVGEVWICSGQSNMEMTVGSSRNAAEEIAGGDMPQIRQIKVPNVISGTPLEDLPSGQWQMASPATVGHFTAVGYFFARKLYNELKVPIGLINTSWGGSMIETWISSEALKAGTGFSDVFNTVSFNDIEAFNDKQFQLIKQLLDSAQGNPGPAPSLDEFKSPTYDHSAWKKMTLPGNFNENGFAKFDGTMWVRKTITLSKPAAKSAVLNLSTIDDSDETYVNGKLVGSTNAYNIVRQYTIPEGILKEGPNVVAVRMTDASGNGGVFGKPADMSLVCADQIIPLAGEWSYRIESIKKNAVGPNSYPSLLFNSMINPLVPFAIKGALWYQGETNADRANQYKTSFPLMIRDWRTRFQQGDFPFYFVQLASFYAGNGNSVKGSSWAELREAQTSTLSLPNTGMAVALDIGETADIHPKNKQDVGIRLAAIALSQQYGINQEYSGPVFKQLRINGNTAVVSFTHSDSGFMVKDKYNYIKGFEIAGADRKFYFAKAYIENGNVVVSSDSVASPVAVRYGWADDMPEANLYNKQGFPAGPFRTDDWAGVTDNVKYVIKN